MGGWDRLGRGESVGLVVGGEEKEGEREPVMLEEALPPPPPPPPPPVEEPEKVVETVGSTVPVPVGQKAADGVTRGDAEGVSAVVGVVDMQAEGEGTGEALPVLLGLAV